MVRLLIVAASAAIGLAACARDEASSVKSGIQATRTVTRVKTKEVRVEVPICPSDDQLRDAAIEVSIATYRNAPNGSRTCACPSDTYTRLGLPMPCAGNTAIKPAEWVMCTREQVPDSVVASMRAKFPGCRSAS